MPPHTYLLTKPIKQTLEKKGRVFVCAKCGQPIRAGEKVVSLVNRTQEDVS